MDLTETDFAKYIIVDKVHPTGSGRQVVLRFPNDFGASLVQFRGSYGSEKGLFEIAVLKFKDESDDFDLTYDTPVTDDVLGYLTPVDCKNTFSEILALPQTK